MVVNDSTTMDCHVLPEKHYISAAIDKSLALLRKKERFSHKKY
jgi:hypothetical protein